MEEVVSVLCGPLLKQYRVSASSVSHWGYGYKVSQVWVACKAPVGGDSLLFSILVRNDLEVKDFEIYWTVIVFYSRDIRVQNRKCYIVPNLTYIAANNMS